MKLRLNDTSFLSLLYFIFVSFLLSPIVHYVSGPVYFWHLSSVLVSLFLIFYLKSIYFSVFFGRIFLVYFLLMAIFSFFFYGYTIDIFFKVYQFWFVTTLFFGTLYFNKVSINFQAKFCTWFFYLEVVVFIFFLIQLVLRIFLPPFSLSDYQNFRIISGFLPQATSFFYEPRGLAQFACTSLYVNLVILNNRYKTTVFLMVIMIFFSFSLGGIITLFFVLAIFFLKRVNKGNYGSILFIFIPFIILFFFLSQFSIIGDRFASLKDDTFGSFSMTVLENGYKLNHKEYYQQYSSEFESDYDIKSGSSSVSTISEVSWLYITLRDRFFFGYYLVDDLRFVSLNGIIDIVLRYGVIGCVLFFCFFRKLVRLDFSSFLFLFFLMSIDGALSKPLSWFLVSVVVVFYSSSSRFS